jgi:AcrR family transcriptional regulator
VSDSRAVDKHERSCFFIPKIKGATTRHQILDRAAQLASQVGVGGLTIGTLAEDLELSKSGVFRHFQSKEALQISVLEHAAHNFIHRVIRPALGEPRGVSRMRALFERWLAWDRDGEMPGGCIFVGAASELDDQPGPVRDRLVELQLQYVDVLETAFRHGIEAGAFDPLADPGQFAQDLYGIMLGAHHHSRLLGDRAADSRARRAFERLLDSVARPNA